MPIFNLWIRRALLMVLPVLLMVTGVLAQDDICPAIVEEALAVTEAACADIGRNEACYGNVLMVAEPQEGITGLIFERTGDIADVAAIRSLELSGMDTEAEQWGVALMRVQANVPDSLPGQNVTFLLFGDVAIENQGGDDNPDGYGPMQAFYFRTGIGDAPCVQAPQSGILVQTPEGAGEITMQANGVDIVLGSTAFLQARPDDHMKFSLLEGHGTASAFGGTREVPAGTWVDIQLDEDGLAISAPSGPLPYIDEDFATLPVNLLPEPITITLSMSEADIDELFPSVIPRPGRWVQELECQDENIPSRILLRDDSLLLIEYPDTQANEFVFERSGDNSYVFSRGNYSSTLRAVSATRIEGTSFFQSGTTTSECQIVITFQNPDGPVG